MPRDITTRNTIDNITTNVSNYKGKARKIVNRKSLKQIELEE